MQELDKSKQYWFVIGSMSRGREIKISDTMQLQGIESYVPLQYEVKQVRNRQQETLVPAISGLIFAHGTEGELKDYISKSRDRLFFRHSAFTSHQEKLIVADTAMRHFMAFVAENQQTVNFFTPEEIEWREGELVRVTIGTKLYEGKIVRMKGKRKKLFALSIPNTAFATIELTPELMQSIERYAADSGTWTAATQRRRSATRPLKPTDDRDDHKSKNLDADKKLLFDKAFRLLFVLSDKQVSGLREYQVTMKEMERVRKRVAPYKGFTAATEGELALPLFMAAMVTGEGTEAATERLRKAIDRLQDTSMLKFRMRFYLARLTQDQTEMASIAETINGWRQHKLQPKQQDILREIEGLL